MSKKYILKDIEQLKQANEFLKTILADIDTYKKERCTSYPVGLPSRLSFTDEYQVNYNEMCISILEYFAEKLGDNEELTIGKYLRVWLDMCETRIRIGISLNNEVQSKLYDEVFGSWSTIYTWFEKQVLPLLTLLTSRYVDFETVIPFFENIGYEDGWNKDRHLSYHKETYTKSVVKAKEIIDDLFKLAENEELLTDVDELLDLYFSKVFKYNKEDDWY
jgi:hypothetical protein